MFIDLRKGWGHFEDFDLTKFPDNSIKFKLKTNNFQNKQNFLIQTTFRTNDDIIALGLVAETIRQVNKTAYISCQIDYLMYQQDDRLFDKAESFGLKFLCKMLNSFGIDDWSIFHPHSDKVEMLDNLTISDNSAFIEMYRKDHTEDVWVIPDTGAFKTQFKQIAETGHRNFISCMKSRNHSSGELEIVVNCDDLEGKNCFIVDDICLGGRTFTTIAEKLKAKNCGEITLLVSHGIFNNGISHLTNIDHIITTSSICTLPESEKLTIYV